MQLERDGVISRNRNFDTFAQPENRGALRLKRRLEHLAALLTDAHRAGELTLNVERVDGHVDLLMELKHVHGRYLARLHPDEMRLLTEKEGVAEVFDACGLDPSQLG